MSERGAQVAILAVVVAGLAYLVISSVDDWGDWVVFAVIVLTAIGAAVAIYPRLYAKRKRSISRTSSSSRSGRPPGGGPRA